MGVFVAILLFVCGDVIQCLLSVPSYLHYMYMDVCACCCLDMPVVPSICRSSLRGALLILFMLLSIINSSLGV